MSEFAILDAAHNVVPATLREWSEMFKGDRHVARTDVNGADVSTVFLGLNHQYLDGPGIWFETMVFGLGGEHQWRYSTWDEAAAGHAKIVMALRAGLPLDEVAQ